MTQHENYLKATAIINQWLKDNKEKIARIHRDFYLYNIDPDPRLLELVNKTKEETK